MDPDPNIKEQSTNSVTRDKWAWKRRVNEQRRRSNLHFTLGLLTLLMLSGIINKCDEEDRNEYSEVGTVRVDAR